MWKTFREDREYLESEKLCGTSGEHGEHVLNVLKVWTVFGEGVEYWKNMEYVEPMESIPCGAVTTMTEHFFQFTFQRRQQQKVIIKELMMSQSDSQYWAEG